MAGEIQLTVGLTAQKGKLNVNKSRITQLLDLAGTRFTETVQNIGFSTHEPLVLNADQLTTGVCWFTNLDAVNYVVIGSLDGGGFRPFLRVLPGESWPARVDPFTVYAKANVAPVDLQFLALES